MKQRGGSGNMRWTLLNSSFPAIKEPSAEDEIAKNIQAMNLNGSPRSGVRGPGGRRNVKSPKGSPAPSPNMAA